MNPQQPEQVTEDETLARHRAFAEVLEGKRPMGWPDWSMFIQESRCLTPDGRRIALWAANTLQRALGDDFLQRTADSVAKRSAGLEPSIHPIFSLGLWPANDVPWVYANLIQLAAQLTLLSRPGANFRRVRDTLYRNLDPINWVSVLLQLEIASLGLRAGWNIQLEPSLGTGRYADVRLTSDVTELLVETVSMRMSDEERKALAFFHSLSQQLMNLEGQFGVRISGSLGDAVPEQMEAVALWLNDCEAAARTTAQDGISRQIPGPNKGQVDIVRPTETMEGESWGLTGMPVTEDTWGRLVARLRDKNRQVAGSAVPIWVRLDEYAGLWHFTPLQNMTLAEKLDALARALQEELDAFPNLAGVILSPAVLWSGNIHLNLLRERFKQSGGIAVRCPIPGHRVRETIIVSQAGLHEAEADIFADWYGQEDSWLNWALQQLGCSSFDTLVQE